MSVSIRDYEGVLCSEKFKAKLLNNSMGVEFGAAVGAAGLEPGNYLLVVELCTEVESKTREPMMQVVGKACDFCPVRIMPRKDAFPNE